MTDNNVFLPHLYDPLRKKIAVSFIQHELRKLFPQLRGESVWKLMDKAVEQWYEDLSIRNFWNAVHGITMGFRLISIVPYITSLNMKWTEMNSPVDNLWFRAKFHPVTPSDVPELARDVKNWLLSPNQKQIFNKTKKFLEGNFVATEPRDYFPIFVVRKESKLRVIDGNGRLLKAIIEGKEKIKAFVGEPVAEPVLFEHWVPTSLLVDLVFWHKRQKENKREITADMAKVIAELIRDSSAGRIEFSERVVHKDDEIHQQLLKAVLNLL